MTRPTRRRFLSVLGAAGVAGIAGCGSNQTDGGGSNGGGSPAGTTEGGAATGEGTGTEGQVGEATETGAGTGTGTGTGTSGAGGQPSNQGSVHLHGSIVIVINGKEYAPGSDPQNYEENTNNPHFHFHKSTPDPKKWHVHSQGVTLAYAIEQINELSYSDGTLTYKGNTYSKSDSQTSKVQILVNGQQVQPSQYKLKDGDKVRLVVQTEKSTPS